MASSRRRGLAPSALADAGEELSATRQLVSETTSTGTLIHDIPVEDVAPHPGNPVSRLEVDDDFVDSIRERGVETPGKVIPVAVYERAGGKVEDLLNPAAKYVIIFGARRWAGVRRAGLATYPAVIHDQEISARDIRIRRIMENLHRLDMAEIDEALDYQALFEELGSQRAVAAAVKKSQPHIHRRLKLLELPPHFQQALRDRAITVEIANELVRFPDEAAEATLAELLAVPKDLEAEQRVAARRQIMERARQDIDRAQRIADAQARAATAGIPVVDDPAARFGDAAPAHRVESRQELEAARAAGSLLAHVTGNGETHYYATELPALATAAPLDTGGITAGADAVGTLHAEQADTAGITAHPGEPADEASGSDPSADTAGIALASRTVRPPAPRRDSDDAERRAATQARSAACRRLVSKPPTREQLVNRLVTRIIDGEQQGHGAAAALACQWLRANGAGPTDLEGVEYLKHVSTTDDPKLRTHFAYALDLALDEIRTSRSRAWDARDAAHVHRLEHDASYAPTPWELTQILAATPAAAAVSE